MPTSSTGEGAAIRTERNTIDIVRVFGEGVLQRPRGNIPQTDSAIVTPTSERLAIRTERNALNTARVFFGDFLAIRPKNNAINTARGFGEGVLQCSRCNIPQMDGAIAISTSERLAIRAERNARNTIPVFGEGVLQGSRGNIP